MSHTAFFYGTLMAPPVLHRVIWGSPNPPTPAHASLLSIRPALLPNHQRRHVRGADYPAVIPVPTPTTTTTTTTTTTSSEPEEASGGSEVRGTLVTGLTDGDIWRLDIFEGDEYARREVEVRVLRGEQEGAQPGAEGEVVSAQTYIWIAGEHRLEEGEWDFAHFVKEKMARWVGDTPGDEGFRDVDDAVAALGDPTGGRGANGQITRELERGGRGEDVLQSAV